MNYLKQYYDEIELGKIKVGNELKAVLDSLICDLDNPKYFFDEKPGELRINFIETFCKHTKSPFNGQPFVLELWEIHFVSFRLPLNGCLLQERQPFFLNTSTPLCPPKPSDVETATRMSRLTPVFGV